MVKKSTILLCFILWSHAFASNYVYKLKGSANGGFPTTSPYALAGVGSEFFPYNLAISVNGLTNLTYLTWESEIVSASSIYSGFPNAIDKIAERLNITGARYHLREIFVNKSGTKLYRLKFGSEGQTFDPDDDSYDIQISEQDLNENYFCFQYIEQTNGHLTYDDSPPHQYAVWIGSETNGQRFHGVSVGDTIEIVSYNSETDRYVSATGSYLLASNLGNSWHWFGQPIEVDRVHEDTGVHRGVTYAYTYDKANMLILVFAEIVLDIRLWEKWDTGEIYGEVYSLGLDNVRLYAQSENGWIVDSATWYRINWYSVNSNQIPQNIVFNPGDPISFSTNIDVNLGLDQAEFQDDDGKWRFWVVTTDVLKMPIYFSMVD